MLNSPKLLQQSQLLDPPLVVLQPIDLMRVLFDGGLQFEDALLGFSQKLPLGSELGLFSKLSKTRTAGVINDELEGNRTYAKFLFGES